jgi:hypothetical protein
MAERGAGLRCWIVALALLAGIGSAHAEQFRTYDNYQIHYNAVRTDFLTPTVARANAITRSKNRALLNITVRRVNPDATTSPSEAQVIATVFNLAGQSQSIPMRAVKEPEAIYYLGEFRIAGEDSYRFEVSVTPADVARTYDLRFAQQLYAE